MKEYGTEMLYKLLQIFFGQADNLMKALILLVIIDYITGVVRQFRKNICQAELEQLELSKKYLFFW